MLGKNISLIYFYVVSLISLLLIIIGVFATINFVLNSTQFDKYPLQYMEDCNVYGMPYKTVPAPDGVEELSEEEKLRQQRACETRTEFERRKNRVQDMRNAIAFTSIGLILFLIHFPIARRHSKNS